MNWKGSNVLSKASVLHNLRSRYQAKLIYVRKVLFSLFDMHHFCARTNSNDSRLICTWSTLSDVQWSFLCGYQPVQTVRMIMKIKIKWHCTRYKKTSKAISWKWWIWNKTHPATQSTRLPRSKSTWANAEMRWSFHSTLENMKIQWEAGEKEESLSKLLNNVFRHEEGKVVNRM